MTTVVAVRFRGGCKTYYFDPRNLEVKTGRDVIVETAQGPEYARCSQGNHEVEDDRVVQPLRPVIRLATENDRRTVLYNGTREKEAFEICQKKILHHGLEMKLVRVECSFDGNKILFFFTADGRVDFRELVKDLASVFRARIELRQIGVRDEAKLLGGLGICGRPFCCGQFMDEFIPVSIKMAKTQNLSLNPTKISGTCGRLMCCLKYEQDAYEDAIKRLPKNDSFVMTPDGPGNVTDVNYIKETVGVRLDDQSENLRRYRGSEIQILRNGKGSRDGIVIPRQRPERYVEEVWEEIPVPSLIAEPEEEPRREEKGEVRRRRSRGRRGGHRGGESEKTAGVAEKTAKPVSAEKNADAPEKAEGSRRSRGHRRGNGEAAQVKAPKPVAEKKDEAAVHHRPRHRGGRRHGGGNRGGSAPKTTE